MNRILLIEDEVKMAKILQNDLKMEGYAVEMAHDGAEGLDKALQGSWDLVILDVMLPTMDGYEVCRQLRAKQFKRPILLLTAKSQETDKLVGFQLGADDYLTKPFSVLELIARIKALIRRVPGNAEALTVYNKGPWQIDFKRQEALKGREKIDLTTKEFQILQYFMSRPDQIISRDEFLRELWKYEELPSTRTVDNQVASLRRKLGWSEDNKGPRILTIHQSGYRFVE